MAGEIQKDLSYSRPFQDEIVIRLLNGLTLREICDDLNLDFNRWVKVVEQPRFQAKLAQIERERDFQEFGNINQKLQKQLTRLVPLALNTYEKILLDGKSEALRKSTADSVMDRFGGPVSSKTEVNVSHRFDAHECTDEELKKELYKRIMLSKEREQQKAIEEQARIEYDVVEGSFEEVA